MKHLSILYILCSLITSSAFAMNPRLVLRGNFSGSNIARFTNSSTRQLIAQASSKNDKRNYSSGSKTTAWSYINNEDPSKAKGLTLLGLGAAATYLAHLGYQSYEDEQLKKIMDLYGADDSDKDIFKKAKHCISQFCQELDDEEVKELKHDLRLITLKEKACAFLIDNALKSLETTHIEILKTLIAESVSSKIFTLLDALTKSSSLNMNDFTQSIANRYVTCSSEFRKQLKKYIYALPETVKKTIIQDIKDAQEYHQLNDCLMKSFTSRTYSCNKAPTSQSGTHIHAIQDLKDPKSWSLSKAIDYHDTFKNLLAELHRNEVRFNRSNMSVFIHGQEKSIGFYQDLYTELMRALDPSIPDDYLFIRFPQKPIIPDEFQVNAKKLREKLLKGTPPIEHYDRENIIFTNAFVAGGCINARTGSCSLDYFLRNKNVGAPNLFIRPIFVNLHAKRTFEKYEEEIHELYHEYQNAIPEGGRILQFAIPNNLLDEVSYMAVPSAQRIGILSSDQTKYFTKVSELMQALREQPESLREVIRTLAPYLSKDGKVNYRPEYTACSIDALEFIIVLPEIVLNPKSGVKIIAHELPMYDSPDSKNHERYEAYKKKFNNLVSKIAEDVKKERQNKFEI